MADITPLRTAGRDRRSPSSSKPRRCVPHGRRRSPARRRSATSRRSACRTRRVEAFKYTDLRSRLPRRRAPRRDALRRGRPRLPSPAPRASPGSRPCASRFVNGHLIADRIRPRPLPAGVTVTPLTPGADRGPRAPRPARRRCGRPRENPIYQLNTAFLADGALIARGGRRQGRDAAAPALRRHRIAGLLHRHPRARGRWRRAPRRRPGEPRGAGRRRLPAERRAST